MSKLKDPITAQDACVAMHTALRKCCYSQPSSMMHSLIQIIDVRPRKWDPWLLFGELVAQSVNRGSTGEVAVKYVTGGLEDAWYARKKLAEKAGRAPPPDNAYACLYALRAALRGLSDANVAGMATFLD